MFNHLPNPVERPADADATVEAGLSAPCDASDAHAIFVVDDDPSVRDSLSVLLETLGFEVCSCASGGEFLADDRRRHAGCLILDQHMPGIDGLATLAALRRDGSNVPAILITGRPDAEIAARAAGLGAMTVLEKPFPVARLLELARIAMGQTS